MAQGNPILPTPGGIQDPVSDDVPGECEIGFSCPARYNASAILFDNLENGNALRRAVISEAGPLTYRELCAYAGKAGQALASLGLERGERILLFLDDTQAYPAFLFGAIRAGFVPVLVNTLTPPDLLNYYLQDAGARALVVDASLAPQITDTAVAGTKLRTIISVGEAAALPAGITVHEAENLLAGFPDNLLCADTHRDDMAFWMYSSGSTGRPKGIVHLQPDMAYTARSFGHHILRLEPDDICFSVPKIFFAYGLGNTLTFPFSVGASSLVHAGRPDPASVFEAIARHRPSVFFGLPTLYTALAKAPEAKEADLSSLRLCLSAAEVLSNEVAASWKSLSGLDIVEGLGSTEMLHIYLSNTAAERRSGSAGRRVPGYEVRLLDKDGEEVADDQEGILWVRGQSSAPLYWNRPDKTAETMRGDWIYTGDRFRRDRDGFHYFRGRADDLIKVSGQWVYPLEVELCIADHPSVREVAVMGVELPDRRMVLRAYVVALDGAADKERLAAELQAYVKTTLLPYKYPREIEFLDELPKTGTGKIDRQALLRRGSDITPAQDASP
ncbi:benzoate-CoA ligase family [Rhizobiales bacterium GAS113]|nr:benzoate-CoA ligase family [Rhizobiales bacterium GAS113]